MDPSNSQLVLVLRRRSWTLAALFGYSTAFISIVFAELVTALLPGVKNRFWADILRFGIVPLLVALPVAGILANRLRACDRAREAAERLATLDPVTGVMNRRRFFDLATVELARALRSRQRMALLLLDIDQFKSINDLFGHPAGDEVLKKVAQVCLSELRPYDVFARFGGDEFALLLPDTESDAAVCIADRLRANVEESTITVDGQQIPGPTISVGVSCMHTTPDCLPELLNRADRAMYIAKRAGRNQIRFAAPEAAGKLS